MTIELTILGWTLVLAIFQIALASTFRTVETGLGFNMSARDSGAPPVGKITARLQRAQANLFETLPLFAAAVLIAHAAGRHNAQTVLACELFLGARVLYLLLYAAGVPVVRTLVWAVSIVGLVMLLKVILAG